MMVSLLKTAVVNGYVNGLRANECRGDRDDEAGTIKAYDDDVVVFAAIQKGRGGAWIARFTDSDRIRWAKPGDK